MSPTLIELERTLRGRGANEEPLATGNGQGDKVAAVYLLFGGPKDDPDLLLIRRGRQLRRHRNEWAFPGGMLEASDETLRHTALRETMEELGVMPSQIDHWGALDPERTRTGFVVWPFTGRLSAGGFLSVSRAEVADVAYVPIAALAAPSSARTISMIEDGRVRTTRAYAYNGRIIWGATARIIGQALKAAGAS